MKLRCPVCHSSNSLEAYAADEAGRELLKLLAGSGPLFRPLVGYLGLFRPASRDLSHERALRLAGEVLELAADPRAMAAALAETVEAMRVKRERGDVRPLKNHNYLKQVLGSVADRAEIIPQNIPSASVNEIAPAPRGKRAQAVASLAEWGRGDWLRSQIADGLAALVALGLEGTPGADMICRTADVWHHVLAGSCSVETLDAERVQRGFSGLLKAVESWPEPKAIFREMPARPRQETLPPAPRTDEEAARGAAFFAGLSERMGLPQQAEKQDEEQRRRMLQEQGRKLKEEG